MFAAGVADYRPKQVVSGTIASGQDELTLTLYPTAKVIEEVRAAHPALYMVAFKYQEGSSQEQLLATARGRLDRFPSVVANRGEEQEGKHTAWMVTRDAEPQQLLGKQSIAAGIADHLEKALLHK